MLDKETGQATPRNVTEVEIDLIKRTFGDNEPLLKSMRALMLGLGNTDGEKSLIKKTFSDPTLMALIAKKFKPFLDKNQPIGQIADVWLGIEEQVYGFSRDTIFQAVQYKDLALKMTDVALALLTNPDGPKVDLEYSPLKYTNDDLQVNLLARNLFIRHVENQLLFLWLIAQQKEKTPKEKAAEIHKDSAK